MGPARLWNLALSVQTRGRIDCLLASFPKSGNTWVRFIAANCLLRAAGIDEPCQTFRQLNAFLPQFGDGRLRQRWEGRPLRPVFVKTHWKYGVIFKDTPAMLIVRNPGDVMVSLYHYLSRQDQWKGGFSEMIRAPRIGVKAWAAHYRSWADRAATLVRYEALRRDAFGTMHEAFRNLGIGFDDEVLRAAVQRSATGNIRRVEQSGDSHEEQRANGFVFVRDGSNEQWRSMFDADDLRYLNSVVPDDFRLER